MVHRFLRDISRRKFDVLNSARIVHSLYQQQKEGKYCDLKVIIEDQKYYVHRCVLATSSPKLDAQIYGLDTIRLIGVTGYGFERLIEILYSGRMANIAVVEIQEFEEIVTAADAINAESVLEYCAKERSDLMSEIVGQSAAEKRIPKVPMITASITSVSTCPAPIKHSPSDKGAASEENDSQDVSDEESQITIEQEQDSDSEDSESDKLSAEDTADEAEDGSDVNSVEMTNSVANKVSSSKEIEIKSVNATLSGPLVKIQRTRHPVLPGMKKGVKCSICKRRFSSPSILKAHMRKHTNPAVFKRPFRCGICDMRFSFQISLKNHLKLHSMKRCICKLCGRDFKLNRNLQLHIENVHPEFDGYSRAPKLPSSTPDLGFLKTLAEDAQVDVDGKFSCPLCDRMFSRRWNLKCHLMSHCEGPRKTSKPEVNKSAVYKCPECGMFFQRLSGVRKHASQVHRGMAVIPKSAEKTKQRAKKTLGKTDYVGMGELTCWCDICGKGFKRARNLRGHMERHTGTGYDCPICGRRFMQKDGLNGHLWVHGGYANPKGEAENMETEQQSTANVETEAGVKGQDHDEGVKGQDHGEGVKGQDHGEICEN